MLRNITSICIIITIKYIIVFFFVFFSSTLHLAKLAGWLTGSIDGARVFIWLLKTLRLLSLSFIICGLCTRVQCVYCVYVYVHQAVFK